MRQPNARTAPTIPSRQLRWALAALVAAVAVALASPARAGVGEISQAHAEGHAA